MAQKSAIENKAVALIGYLKKEGLLTKEYEFTAQLLRELAVEFNNAANAAQRASISKEIRETVRMLPMPSHNELDPANDFFSQLEDAK
jgi:hypothetical protein